MGSAGGWDRVGPNQDWRYKQGEQMLRREESGEGTAAK